MKKIIIVDDHPDIRQLIRITLGGHFEVIEASEAIGALELIRSNVPELIILDVGLPGQMDGLQLLDAIRAAPALAKSKVVMVTAKGTQADRESGLARGAQAYFSKPFSPIQLVNTIKDLIA